MAMDARNVLQQIEEDGIVAVMRGAFPPAVAVRVCSVLAEEGIRSFELTMNSVQPIEAMQAVKQALGEQVAVGMGTVLDVESARKAIQAGADFVVSPAFQPDVVKFSMGQNVLMIPGVITPSEAVAAWEMGTPILKLFPIGALGSEYFQAMFGPLDHMKFMCNGAMNADTTRELIQSGAVAVGMGGWLTGDGTWTDSKLRSRAHVLKNAVAAGRGLPQIEEA